MAPFWTRNEGDANRSESLSLVVGKLNMKHIQGVSWGWAKMWVFQLELIDSLAVSPFARS